MRKVDGFENVSVRVETATVKRIKRALDPAACASIAQFIREAIRKLLDELAASGTVAPGRRKRAR